MFRDYSRKKLYQVRKGKGKLVRDDGWVIFIVFKEKVGSDLNRDGRLSIDVKIGSMPLLFVDNIPFTVPCMY